MAITYTLQTHGDLLHVETSGTDENLAGVKSYGAAIIQAAVQGACRRVLCDETGSDRKSGTVDTFEAAQFIAAQAPRIAQIAIVCKTADFRDASFWETVAVNRGLRVKAFQTLDAANKWLEI